MLELVSRIVVDEIFFSEGFYIRIKLECFNRQCTSVLALSSP